MARDGEHRRPFRLAQCGGTFGHLHAGHRRYIEVALGCAGQVQVWVADGQAHGSKPYVVPSFEVRKAAIEQFLDPWEDWQQRVSVVRFTSGREEREFLLSSPELDLVVVEPDWEVWAAQLAAQRKAEVRAGPLAVLVVPRMPGISSSQVARHGCHCLCHDLGGGPCHPGERCECNGGRGYEGG